MKALPKFRQPAKAKAAAQSGTKSPVQGGWKMFTESLTLYRANWWGLAKIILIVSLPVNLATSFSTIQADSVLGPFLSLGQLVMNVALVYAVSRLFEGEKLPSATDAYYDGSSVMVRYLLVTFLAVMMMFPALIGMMLLGLVFVPDSVIQTTVAEQGLMAFLALLFTIPTIYLLVRNGLGLIAVVREPLRPFAALRASRLITHRYFWMVLRRGILIAFCAALISLPISALTVAGYSYLKWQQASIIFFQLATSLTALPIITIYFFKLYLALESRFEYDAHEDHEKFIEEASTSIEDAAIAADKATATEKAQEQAA